MARMARGAPAVLLLLAMLLQGEVGRAAPNVVFLLVDVRTHAPTSNCQHWHPLGTGIRTASCSHSRHASQRHRPKIYERHSQLREGL